MNVCVCCCKSEAKEELEYPFKCDHKYCDDCSEKWSVECLEADLKPICLIETCKASLALDDENTECNQNNQSNVPWQRYNRLAMDFLKKLKNNQSNQNQPKLKKILFFYFIFFFLTQHAKTKDIKIKCVEKKTQTK